jgi:hypothetical protein
LRGQIQPSGYEPDKTPAGLCFSMIYICITRAAIFRSNHFTSSARLVAPPLAEIDFQVEDRMNILAAIKREERKLEKQLGHLQKQLDGVRAAGKALGHTASRDLARVKKRVLSEAGRAKIAKAAKKRWAKVRAQAKKAVG